MHLAICRSFFIEDFLEIKVSLRKNIASPFLFIRDEPFLFKAFLILLVFVVDHKFLRRKQYWSLNINIF